LVEVKVEKKKKVPILDRIEVTDRCKRQKRVVVIANRDGRLFRSV
jgi:hypothetical protein